VTALWQSFLLDTTTALRNAAATPCISKGASAPKTRTFLAALAAPGGLLPSGLAPGVSSLLATLGSRYDGDVDANMDVQEAVDLVLKDAVGQWIPPVREQVLNAVLRHLRMNLRYNQAMRLRCQAVCEICHMPCEKACNHDGLHDTNHQVQGLSGVQVGYSSCLCSNTCTQAVRKGWKFLWPVESDNWHKFKDFAKVFPGWSTPNEYRCNHVREYVFVKFQKELAAWFNWQPATDKELQVLNVMEKTALREELERCRAKFVEA
jgi:hypothetical protein